jgi:hypothetical protein
MLALGFDLLIVMPGCRLQSLSWKEPNACTLGTCIHSWSPENDVHEHGVSLTDRLFSLTFHEDDSHIYIVVRISFSITVVSVLYLNILRTPSQHSILMVGRERTQCCLQ